MESTYLDFTKNIDYDKLHEASQSLVNGNLVVFPTDTVYGIGCNPFKEDSILKLFHAKSRPHTKPVNVLISNLNMLHSIVETITDVEYKLMDAFWPGPLTIIFKKSSKVSNTLTSGFDTIGVRMPDNQIALQLIEDCGIPIATSSANISDYCSPIQANDVTSDFYDKTSFIIDGGKSSIGLASTIVKIENNIPYILRKRKYK